MVSANGVGVAIGALLTWVTDAGIVQLAEQTWRRYKVDFVITNLDIFKVCLGVTIIQIGLNC